MTPEITPLGALRLDLGEGPVWHPREQCLYVVDVGETRAIHRYDEPGVAEMAWQAPETVASVAFRDDGTFVASLASGFALVDAARGQIVTRVAVAPDAPTRLNDGKVSPDGRFFCVGMDLGASEPLAGLHRLDPDLTLHHLDDGFAVGNGLAFSPDGTVAYIADSVRNAIWTYAYDPEGGEVTDGRLFCDGTGLPGAPDGATVDVEGHLWSARWGGGCIVRYAPDGTVDRVLDMPVGHPTCPVFGGADLEVLYVTSGSQWTDRAREPLAGATFRIDGLDVRGHEASLMRSGV